LVATLKRQAEALETLSVEVPEAALEAYELALSSVCASVGFFRDHETGAWHVEGVKPVGGNELQLSAALVLAAGLTGVEVPVQRAPTQITGWLAQTHASFPEQLVGRRFAVRGTHLHNAPWPGRITLTLDAGLAFGSGEHGSTRGCLRALERVVWRRPRRILDLGTGSGILAIAAARLVHRRVMATDIEPFSVRVAQRNVMQNRLGRLVKVRLADGWQSSPVRAGGPYDLVLANVLARPLCLMARRLALHLVPGGTAIVSGLLRTHVRGVLAAHRRHGLRLETALYEDPWTTLILRR
jgi:ribosomal protein L11 methyltransferase